MACNRYKVRGSHGHGNPREATFANIYPYVWLKFGVKWVPFQSKVEQEGYTEMGIFLGSFSNMGTIVSIHMKPLHAYT